MVIKRTGFTLFLIAAKICLSTFNVSTFGEVGENVMKIVSKFATEGLFNNDVLSYIFVTYISSFSPGIKSNSHSSPATGFICKF